MSLDPIDWNRRYVTRDTGWDLGQVSPPLKQYVDSIKDKSLKILIPGAGNGYEAEYLFSQGFKNIYVLDIAPLPLGNIKKRIPSFPTEQLMQQDFFKLEDTFDLILEQTFFCAIPVKMRSRYADQMAKLLNPEGKVAGVLFNRKFEGEGPPFGGSLEEYLSYFSPIFTIEVFETCYNSIPARQGSELFFIIKKK